MIASFLARRTMFSIIAPELKSLKYRISLSPEAYVTSRNRFRSLGSYICSTVFSIIRLQARPCVAAVRSTSSGWIGIDGVQVLRHDVGRLLWLGRSILIFTSSRPGRRMAGSMRSSRLEAPITITFLNVSTPSSSRQELRHDRRLDVGGDAAASRAEDRVHLVEEDDDREALLAPLLRTLEDLADLALRLAHVLVQQLGPLDVQEVAPRVLAAGTLARPSPPATWRRPSRSASCRTREAHTAGRPWAARAGVRRRAPRTGTAARPRRGWSRSVPRDHRCPRS